MSSQSTATPNAASDSVPLAGVRSIACPLTLILATLTTGLISGFFYTYACSVTLGLALLLVDGAPHSNRCLSLTLG
jgi:hypothetical protein